MVENEGNIPIIIHHELTIKSISATYASTDVSDIVKTYIENSNNQINTVNGIFVIIYNGPEQLNQMFGGLAHRKRKMFTITIEYVDKMPKT